MALLFENSQSRVSLAGAHVLLALVQYVELFACL